MMIIFVNFFINDNITWLWFLRQRIHTSKLLSRSSAITVMKILLLTMMLIFDNIITNNVAWMCIFLWGIHIFYEVLRFSLAITVMKNKDYLYRPFTDSNNILWQHYKEHSLSVHHFKGCAHSIWIVKFFISNDTNEEQRSLVCNY